MEDKRPVEAFFKDGLLEEADLTNDAVIYKDMSNIIIGWSAQAEKVFGFSRNEVLGRNISLILPENKIAEENQITNLLKNGIAVNSYYTVRINSEGHRIHVMLSLTEVTNDEGEITAVREIIKDITAQRTAEEKQGILSAIVDSSDDAIISKDFDGIITSWNKGAENIFGYKEKEVIGKPITILIPPDNIEEEAMIIGKIRKGERVEHFETVRRRKDGSHIWVSLTVSPVKNLKGEIIGASKIARDITRQRKDEMKQGMLAAIVDSSDDAIMSKDLNGIITSWNKGAERIFGYTESEIIGKSIHTLIPENRREEEGMILAKINKGEKVEHFETVRIAKNGRELFLSITVSPIRNSKGEIVGVSKIGRDISEKVKINRQLALYNERLEKLNDYKDEFIGMVSHELKTPLTSIKASLQIIERKVEAGEHRVFISKTLKQVGVLANMIEELLDVSRIKTGELELNLSSYNFEDILRESIDRVKLNNNSHEIITGEMVKARVLADKQRIIQILTNLLLNAIKYSPKADKVLVDSSLSNNELRVRIQDFGIGMSKEELKKVFSKYFKVETPVPSFSGLGVGLYIYSKIIELHNGKMWVESEPGKGSVFYFTLPVQKSGL